MSVSTKHTGWRRDRANSRLDIYYEGTRVGHVDATEMLVALGLEVDGALDIDGASNFAGEAEFAGNVHIQSTLEAGTDGVGSDGEQLTSGGAAAECDWAAASSLRQMKNILGIRNDDDEALETLAKTPVYDFKYRDKSEAKEGERIVNTGDVETVYRGIMADEAPWAMHFGGRILNPVSTFGITVQAVRALLKRNNELEARIASLEGGSA